jgi:putative ABC transport system permease protein
MADLTGAGIALGLPLSYALARVMESQFYGIGAHDPLNFAGGTLLIACVAGCAALLPSLRAMRIDPAVAPRSE